MLTNYQKINNITGWLVFAIAAVVYLLTLEPTTSFWDCGEYIATAYKIQVGHPPGAPLFLLLANVFSNFARGDVTQVALMVNAMSALCSAFTILFLFWTITALAKKIVSPKELPSKQSQIIAILGSGAVGALAYTFSDSFWFSAVEGEVYAMSSFFTAIVIWAILKWEQEADSPKANRWLVLITYLMGLSIGVHLLNLLTIPAVVFIYYFKKKKEINAKGIISTLIISILLLGAIFFVIVPQFVNVSGKIELFAVNSLGLPFHSGTIVFFILVVSLIVMGLKATKKKGLLNANTAILATTFLLIGYSSFIILAIRSNANPPIDENNPEDAVSLLAYLNREQYGSVPLGYGQYFNADVKRDNEGRAVYKSGTPVYVANEEKGIYEISDDRKDATPVYEDKNSGIFPRMWSPERRHIESYMEWTGMRSERKPTFSENIKFFIDFQVVHMYYRYFMWNFAGRQNDLQGHGGIVDGNWVSGIEFVDEMRLGPQNSMPDYMKNNRGKNHFYFLPLILGIIGLYYHYKASAKDAWVVTLIFLFTGLAIVVYLNQYPYQPRERDYAYVGSFYAFAIWIGLGVLGIYQQLSEKAQSKGIAVGITAICLLAVPGLMASEGWDDHDRSGRTTARDFAKNYLDSCDKDAILFTMGDNDTFPLWYVQEVEGYRTDVRVVNLSLLNTDWYIDQMKRHAYEGKAVPISMSHDLYKQGTRDIAIFQDAKFKEAIDINDFNEWIKSEDQRTKVDPRLYGKSYKYYPTRNITIPVDKEIIKKNNIVPEKDYDKILDQLDWNVGFTRLEKKHMIIIDMLANNNWERPVYFAITIGNGPAAFINLADYLQLDGMVYKLVPIKNDKPLEGQMGRVDSDVLYDNLMNKFSWGNMEDPKVYLDETNLRMTMNFRNNFSRLATQLVEEKKFDKAIEVLDECMLRMPHERVPYNFFVLPIAESYLMAGAEEKGEKLLNDLFSIYESELLYYAEFSLDKKERFLTDEIRRAIYFCRTTYETAESYRLDETANDIKARYQVMLQKLK